MTLKTIESGQAALHARALDATRWSLSREGVRPIGDEAQCFEVPLRPDAVSEA